MKDFCNIRSYLKPPSRKKLSDTILTSLHKEAVANLKTSLTNIKYVAITTDMWTSENNIGYITITCSFITEADAKLQSRVLATKDIEEISSSVGSHTAEALGTAILSVLSEWNITKKVVTVVSDNAANVKKAMNENLKMHHHPCVAHTLNLVFQYAISGVEKLRILFKKYKTLIAHFKHSVRATLIATQKQMNLPTLKVKQDVPTRWNSVLIMMERLLEIKDPLCLTVSRLQKLADVFFDATEWQILQDCVKILKPAEELTKILSAESYCTISMVIPLIRGMQSSLRSIVAETEIGEKLKNTLIEITTRRLEGHESNKIVAKATFLDPRFKKCAFGTEGNTANAQKWVTKELTQLVADKNSSSCTSVATTEQTSPVNASVSTGNSNLSTLNIWSHFDQKVCDMQSHSTPNSTVILMVRQYLELPLLDRKENPLEFWMKHKNLMPELCELAFKYLCIPSTSVPSERVFSKTGQLTIL